MLQLLVDSLVQILPMPSKPSYVCMRFSHTYMQENSAFENRFFKIGDQIAKNLIPR